MPEIIIFERRPRWGPELERCAQYPAAKSESPAGDRMKVTSIRSLTAVRAAEFERGTILVLDVSAGVPECLHLLGRLLSEIKRCHVIVMGSSSSHPLEWIFYEMGTTVYLPDCDHGEQLMLVCRRLLPAG
ncbi:MAG: hypothetical protein ACKVT0_09765 [Planctomycetaceae bacterium]